MCERLHGDADHPDFLYCVRSYAIGLERMGRFDEALPVYKRALEMCERLHGDADHPDFLYCVRSYAIGLERMGRVDEAFVYHERAKVMYERLGNNEYNYGSDLFTALYYRFKLFVQFLW